MNIRISMRKIAAVFQKQIKDTFKNKEVLIQFVMFPLMAVIMEGVIDVQGLEKNYFVKLFATMFTGMAPLVVTAAIIAEEKEKNTLRMLLLSDVRPREYLIGVGGYVWISCMLGAGIFAAAGGYEGRELVEFLGIMAAGITVSMMIGAVIGTWSRNQMMATSLSVPVMLIFSFLPMLSAFNSKIQTAARWVFSGQVGKMLGQIGEHAELGESIGIIVLNTVIAGILFRAAYRKCGLA